MAHIVIIGAITGGLPFSYDIKNIRKKSQSNRHFQYKFQFYPLKSMG